MTLKDQMREALAKAKAIAAKAEAERRDMTDDEVTAARGHLNEFERVKALYEKGLRSDETMRALRSIGLGFPGLGDEPTGSKDSRVEVYSRRNVWAQKAMRSLNERGLITAGGPDGVKALVSGSISVPNLLDAGDPVEIDAPRRTLLDLIGRGSPRDGRVGNEFQYMRQTTRTNNAAAIADGENKPTSIYTFGEVTDHYRTYVNKTEDLPYRYLADYERLMDVVEKQLAEDMMVAIEQDILSGEGPDEEAGTDAFVGILETTGIQVQVWATDLLTTLSNAKHKFIAQELPFNGWVLNPTDLQTLELMREDGATGPFLFSGRSAIEDWLGGPVATSAGMPTGNALVGDFTQAEIIPLGDDELVVDTGKRTTNNTFLLMHEGRYGFRVKKPGAFVQVETIEPEE
ncbi:phage major capsid protein [Microbacterium schleiferi]|uniref:phage major capsid protein n=1 Tax=Microbacterium schleiferi TaxID=69362 RepID=UPI00311EAF68